MMPEGWLDAAGVGKFNAEVAEVHAENAELAFLRDLCGASATSALNLQAPAARAVLDGSIAFNRLSGT